MLSHPYTFVLIRCTVYDIIVRHVVDSNNGRGVYSRAVFISLSALEGAAFNRINTVTAYRIQDIPAAAG